jgi:hypothetical protein
MNNAEKREKLEALVSQVDELVGEVNQTLPTEDLNRVPDEWLDGFITMCEELITVMKNNPDATEEEQEALGKPIMMKGFKEMFEGMEIPVEERVTDDDIEKLFDE